MYRLLGDDLHKDFVQMLSDARKKANYYISHNTEKMLKKTCMIFIQQESRIEMNNLIEDLTMIIEESKYVKENVKICYFSLKICYNIYGKS